MSWKSLERAADDGPMQLTWWFFWRGFVCFLLLTAVGGCMSLVTNPFRQAGRIVAKTIDADNVIANYEWFKQQHESIAAIEAKIVGAQQAVVAFEKSAGDRKDWHRVDREEHARLSAIALGLEQQRSDLAATYNARSRMVNRSVFKTGDAALPESISVTFTGGVE